MYEYEIGSIGDRKIAGLKIDNGLKYGGASYQSLGQVMDRVPAGEEEALRVWLGEVKESILTSLKSSLFTAIESVARGEAPLLTVNFTVMFKNLDDVNRMIVWFENLDEKREQERQKSIVAVGGD